MSFRKRGGSWFGAIVVNTTTTIMVASASVVVVTAPTAIARFNQTITASPNVAVVTAPTATLSTGAAPGPGIPIAVHFNRPIHQRAIRYFGPLSASATPDVNTGPGIPIAVHFNRPIHQRAIRYYGPLSASATPGSGSQTLAAGVQIAVVTAPTATRVAGSVSLAAGTEPVVVTAPTAVRLATIARSAGTQPVVVTAPTSILVSGSVSRAAGTQPVVVTAPTATLSTGAAPGPGIPIAVHFNRPIHQRAIRYFGPLSASATPDVNTGPGIPIAVHFNRPIHQRAIRYYGPLSASATPGSGSQTLAAGVQIAVVTAPTATRVAGSVSLAAGTEPVVVTAPTAVRLATIARSAGTQPVVVTAPTSILVSGSVSRAAGTQPVVVTAPTARIPGSILNRAAGTQTVVVTAPAVVLRLKIPVAPQPVVVTAPTANPLSGSVALASGANRVVVTAPVATRSLASIRAAGVQTVVVTAPPVTSHVIGGVGTGNAVVRVELQFAPGVWTSLGSDVIADAGVRWTRGMSGNTPHDRVAVTGTLEFALRNDNGNTGGIAGWYSPNSASCRAGFTFGIPVRVVINDGTDHVVWTGKLRTIQPTPGKELAPRTLCTGQDKMGDLAEADVRAIAPQANKTEVELLQAIIAALPTEAQPDATSYDSALDVYPFAFDDLAGGVKAMDALTRVVTSAQGLLYVKADGTLRYDNRHTVALRAISYAFAESELLAADGLSVPSSLANAYNRVRVTTHPKSTASSLVLFGISGPQMIAPGQTVTIWGDYYDANNTLKLIGGTAQTTPIVATTDYTGNSVSDGSGIDYTADLSITTYAFAASVKFDVMNASTTHTVYLTKCQVRGTAIYDNAPQTFESFTAQDYGDRPLDVDLGYQTSGATAQDLADYLKAQYIALADQVESASFDPQVSNALMTQAVTREIGDVVTVTETQTGVTAVRSAILGIHGSVGAGSWVRQQYLLVPQVAGAYFILDDAVYGVLDSTAAVLGYA